MCTLVDALWDKRSLMSLRLIPRNYIGYNNLTIDMKGFMSLIGQLVP